MKLEIGGTNYEFEYTVNAVCEIEEQTKKLLGQVISTKGFSGLRALMWGGLIEHQPSVTIKDAGKILQEYLTSHTQEDFIVLIGGAFEQAGFLKAQGRK